MHDLCPEFPRNTTPRNIGIAPLFRGSFSICIDRTIDVINDPKVIIFLYIPIDRG